MVKCVALTRSTSDATAAAYTARVRVDMRLTSKMNPCAGREGGPGGLGCYSSAWACVIEQTWPRDGCIVKPVQ